MHRWFLATAVVLWATAQVSANGILIPEEKKLPPLAMVQHLVQVRIDEQVAMTDVEQVFRNHTDRALEATYIFPVPKGASVRKFAMVVDGKEMVGELLEAAKAREIYTAVVSRTKDPALLEYIDHNLLRFKVFPVPARGDVKIKLSYTSVAPADNGLIDFIYPLRTDGKSTRTLEKFGMEIRLKSQHAIQNIYSPTHNITTTRSSDKEATVIFEKQQALLDRDFQLYYTAGTKDIGITTLTHRHGPDGPGYFMLLASPRAELSKSAQVPRDIVFVLDTSGSMSGKRLVQAKAALKYCLNQLDAKDRFAILHFATVVNGYSDNLLPASASNVKEAAAWVERLQATGGTAIDAALARALDIRGNDANRTQTIVFFTDGRPTVGETNPEKILQNVVKRNAANTRIFTFGVGDDVNASLLDRLADETRAVASYVRESEDIEAKVSGLYSKFSHPVLANLKLTVGPDVTVSEIYPPHLPDLFQGGQLIVLGRYTGSGHAVIKLTGQLGNEVKEFVYEVNFPAKTSDDRGFVEDLWARRKVGYLLDQIRVNGERKELIDEVVALAKRYGIATPYTSYLIAPDAVLPVAGAGLRKEVHGKPDVSFKLIEQSPVPPALSDGKGGAAPVPVTEFLNKTQQTPGKSDQMRFGYLARELDSLPMPKGAPGNAYEKAMQDTKDRFYSQNQAGAALKKGDKAGVQGGKLGVDLSCENSNLRNQSKLTQTASQFVNGRNCLEVGGVWIDDGYDIKMPTVNIKAMSPAYFRMLELQPNMRDVFRMGNHLVYVTPSGSALVVDANNGVETLPDGDIKALFVRKK